ncbi:MAG TPA: TolC family protein [Sandaracinaceae bacterium]
MTRSTLAPFALAALASFAPSAALAQQPLSTFLRAAGEHALDVREAEAAMRQARSQVDEARARLLPSITGQLSYQRNEPVVEITIPTGETDGMGNPITRQASITPRDQFGALASVSVPIVDLSAWAGYFATEAVADASDAQLDLVRQNVDVAVVQLWHQLVAQRALVEAAERNLQAAQAARDAAAARVEVGVSGQLELARADAELARARQALSEARLAATLAARNLENLTSVRPTEERAPLEDDLSPEAPLERFLARANEMPAVRAARHQARAAGIQRDSAWMAMLPTISATGVARWSNAAGFGRQDSYYVGLTATWTLDFARPARIGTAEAALEGAEVRAERAVQQVETAIFEAWQRVEASRASAEAASAALEASRRAAQDARARYEAGAGTQLEQIQAERDLFQAEVAHIQAIANLRVARAVLRIRSGLDV